MPLFRQITCDDQGIGLLADMRDLFAEAVQEITVGDVIEMQIGQDEDFHGFTSRSRPRRRMAASSPVGT